MQILEFRRNLIFVLASLNLLTYKLFLQSHLRSKTGKNATRSTSQARSNDISHG